MKQGSFEKAGFMQASAQTVINIIADYSQYPKTHPLIKKCQMHPDIYKNQVTVAKVTVTLI